MQCCALLIIARVWIASYLQQIPNKIKGCHDTLKSAKTIHFTSLRAYALEPSHGVKPSNCPAKEWGKRVVILRLLWDTVNDLPCYSAPRCLHYYREEPVWQPCRLHWKHKVVVTYHLYYEPQRLISSRWVSQYILNVPHFSEHIWPYCCYHLCYVLLDLRLLWRKQRDARQCCCSAKKGWRYHSNADARSSNSPDLWTDCSSLFPEAFGHIWDFQL